MNVHTTEYNFFNITFILILCLRYKKCKPTYIFDNFIIKESFTTPKKHTVQTKQDRTTITQQLETMDASPIHFLKKTKKTHL